MKSPPLHCIRSTSPRIALALSSILALNLAGGGVRPGIEYGETDDYGYSLASPGVHIRDLKATILRCLGLDYRRFSFLF
jgi:hypothetical protein